METCLEINYNSVMADPEIERLLSELRDWCKAQYGRQSEVARALGVSRQQVYDWINRRTMPTLAMGFRLQGFLRTHKPRQKGPKRKKKDGGQP